MSRIVDYSAEDYKRELPKKKNMFRVSRSSSQLGGSRSQKERQKSKDELERVGKPPKKIIFGLTKRRRTSDSIETDKSYNFRKIQNFNGSGVALSILKVKTEMKRYLLNSNNYKANRNPKKYLQGLFTEENKSFDIGNSSREMNQSGQSREYETRENRRKSKPKRKRSKKVASMGYLGREIIMTDETSPLNASKAVDFVIEEKQPGQDEDLYFLQKYSKGMVKNPSFSNERFYKSCSKSLNRFVGYKFGHAGKHEIVGASLDVHLP